MEHEDIWEEEELTAISWMGSGRPGMVVAERIEAAVAADADEKNGRGRRCRGSPASIQGRR